MKNLKIAFKKSFSWGLIPIFIIALILRWWYLPAKAIFFSFDQGRDAFIVQEILGGHLKVLGPPVSGVPGLFNGALYYYVIAPFYLLGHGSPIVVSYWFSFLNALGIFVIYYLVYFLTKKRTPSIVSAFIYACSYEASQYANLITNASMAEWFIPLFYIGLYLWITKKWKWAPVLAAFGLGFSLQSEIARAFNFVPLVVWLFLYRKNINLKQILIFIVALIFSVLPMIISEIKFGFTGISGLIYLLTRQDKITQSISAIDFVKRFLLQSSETLSYTLFPANIVIGGILGFGIVLFSIYKTIKDKNKKEFPWAPFLAFAIFSYVLALPFGGWNMRHIMVGTSAEIAAFAGIFIWKYFDKKTLILLIIIAIISFSNIYQILKDNIHGQIIFSLDSDLVLSTETQVLDYVYLEAGGKPFSISTLTSPLFINTTWSYLFNWYGKTKYGYLPYWIGRDQIGQLGNDLKNPPKGVTKHFFISESTFGIPDIYVTYANGDQDSMSKLINQKKFGQIIVQEREIR